MYNAMKTPSQKEIIDFLKENIEPINDEFFGDGYRASATLKDGTYLPCVIFRNPTKTIDIAIKRFKEEQSGNGIFANKSKGFGYREIVKSFVTKGNCVNDYEINEVDTSRFSVPFETLRKINGETAMSWTAFVAEFNDGRKLSFGTTWSNEFFDLPEDYEFNNISKIYSGYYLSKLNELVPHKSLKQFEELENYQKIYRERQFFECYIENL
ncbi:hypothetical protein ASG01_15485 [Chryseobacterium sp. Leaf180]|jgi:hypothetical protein|nr:hypothetical protein ASG01_15485 [Chryseobacterium sp. Leaf180]